MIAYSPEQYARVVELWDRAIDLYFAELYEQTGYRPTHRSRIDDTDLYERILSNGEETDDANEWRLDLIGYSDGSGTDWDAANVRYIEETHEWVDIDETYGGGKEAYLIVGCLPGSDDDDIDDRIGMLESLVDDLGRLEDYPILSDDIHGQYVDELATEAWDQWLGSDVRSDIETRMEDEYPDFDALDYENVIREAYYDHENEWNCTSATEVTNGHHDEAVDAAYGEVLRLIKRGEAELNEPVDPGQLALVPAPWES
jgi:hypothetical protein